MEDIAPQLLEKLEGNFQTALASDPQIRALGAKIRDGKADFEDGAAYGHRVGQILAGVFQRELSPAELPDGRMYYNIASRVVRPLLEADHTLIAQAASQIQKALNERSQIGLNPAPVAVDEERIQGILDSLSQAPAFEEIKWVLDVPVVSFSQTVVDRVIQENVALQGKAGLRPKVVRKSERKCCPWCAALAGEYEYPDVPEDVYRRHGNCRCVVLFDPGDGRRQNVHSKQWTVSRKDATMESRKLVGLRVNQTTIQGLSGHALERMELRSVTAEAIQDALSHPLDIGKVKYDAQGRPSFTVVGKAATVAINPETGILTTAYPTHTKTAEKLLDRK